MLIVAAALGVAASSPAGTSAQFAGLYEINQMEMAGGLELQPNGRFRYAFDYGAVSEEAEGSWKVEDGTVLLTTDPMPPRAECDRGYASACFNRTEPSQSTMMFTLTPARARSVIASMNCVLTSPELQINDSSVMVFCAARMASNIAGKI